MGAGRGRPGSGDYRYLTRPRPDGTWYVSVDVPRSLRAAVGKKRLLRSLQTSDLELAQRFRWPVVASMKEEIASAAGRDVTTARRSVTEEAMAWREAIRNAKDWEERALLEGLVEDRVQQWNGRLAPPSEEMGVDAPALDPDAAAWGRIALGVSTPLREFEERWLAGSSYAARTKADCRTALAGLEAWLIETGRPSVVETITSKVASEYRDLGLVAKGVPVGTANKKMTLLRQYWTWMFEAGEVEEGNPWDRKSLPKPKKHLIKPDAPNAPERPFTDDEVRTLLSGKTDQDLADAMLIGALSGLRIDEIGQLRVGDCKGGMFAITSAKTEAGVRSVPVHSGLAEVVKRRTKGQPANAFLFPALRDTGWDGNRTMALSKRFATYRRRLGVDDRRPGSRRSKVNFHSFRRWFATKCEEAGQPENVVAKVMGHSKGTITFGLYSQADLTKLMRKCVAAVKLPKAGS